MVPTEKLASWLMAEGVGSDARGLESLKQGLGELERDRPERARRLALSVLAQAPHSKPALALWSDAAGSMGLEQEVREALRTLTSILPGRADLWWRLSQAEQALGGEARGPAERALEVAAPRPAALRAARWLFREALDDNDVQRATRFAEHLKLGFEVLENAHLDLAELELEHGRLAAARRALLGGPPPALLDARGWLTLARAAEKRVDARRPLERALILGPPRVLSKAAELACLQPELARQVLPLVERLGCADVPEWALARALATASDSERSLACARQADRTPLASVALIWLRVALAREDRGELARAAEFAASWTVLESHPLELEAERLLGALRDVPNATKLALLEDPLHFAPGWAAREREQIYAEWLERQAFAPLLDQVAGQLPSGFAALVAQARRRLDEVPTERLAVALMGEFNAGKSSLVNAFTGSTQALVGVTPTTKDPQSYDWQGFRLIDTPGFNAPYATAADLAAAALERAHAVLWIVDGSLPFRDSEARRLLAIQERGLPFWVLVNKQDRIPAEERTRLLAYVEEGLFAQRLEPARPVLGVSAREPVGLQPVVAEFGSWLANNERRLRRGACLRVVRQLVDGARVPSSAERQLGEADASSALRASLDAGPLGSLQRALERAENNLKR